MPPLRRMLPLAGAAVLLLAGGAYLAAPTVMQRVAEGKVDTALKRLRVQTTSVVTRGDVTIDLWSRTVFVEGLSVDGPGGGSKVRIGRLVVVNPAVVDDQLTADTLALEDATIEAGADTTVIPRIEITKYSGPERGLATTPGVGANARSQAEVFADVSFERASAPVITITNSESRLRRTLRNPEIRNVVKGLVERAEISGSQTEAPYLEPDEAPTTSAVSVSSGQIVYEGLSLPALQRFYAGDGAGEREPLFKSFTVADIELETTLRPEGHISAGIAEITITNAQTRSLGYPLTKLDPIAARLRLGAAPTPAEVRDQLLLAADWSSAVAIDGVLIRGVRAKSEFPGRPNRNATIDRVEIGRYADATLDQASLTGLVYQSSDRSRVSLAQIEGRRFDARGLVDYARRVGRNEVLLTTTPTPEEVVKIFPRVTRIDASGFDAANPSGSLKFGRAKIDVDAPLDAVPQRVRAKLEALDLAPPAESQIADLLKRVELDGLKGSASIAATLDPTTGTLSLDSLDYEFEQLGSVTAKGELSTVNPMLAVATGAAFVDQITAVRLGPVRITAKDDGAVAVLLRRAADAAGTPPEEFRETFARETQETIFGVFGPSAENSAEAAARFIREPRSIEFIITPRNADQTLVEFLQSLNLGLVGVAQTIEFAALYKR